MGPGEEMPEPFTLESLLLVGEAGILPSWLLTSGWGRRLDENPEEEGWRGWGTGGMRKGVAAGEKLETSGPLGSRTVHSHTAAGGPVRTPLSSAYTAFCCRPLPLAPAHALRSPAPLKSPQLHS